MRVLSLVIGLLVLTACAAQQDTPSSTSPSDIWAFPPDHVAPAQTSLDYQACATAFTANNDLSVWGNCMLSKEYVVLYDGYLYYNNQQPIIAQYCISDSSPPPCLFRSNMGELVLKGYDATSNANNQPSTPEPENPPSSGSPSETANVPSLPPPAPATETETTENNAAPAVARLQNILDKDAYWILKAAHFAGVYESESTRIASYSEANAVLVQDISWHGILSGTSYHTTLRFTATYNNPDAIDNIDIEATDTNDPPPIWLGTTVIKSAAILALIDEIAIIRGAAVLANVMRGINAFISVKDALAFVLKNMASR